MGVRSETCATRGGRCSGSEDDLVQVRLFGPAAEAAGTSVVHIERDTVEEVLRAVRARFGSPLCEILDRSRVWLGEEEARATQRVRPSDELAVLPPVSGG